MPRTQADLKAAHEAACLYPHTTPDMFRHAALIRIDSGEIVIDESTRRSLIDTSPISRPLQGTSVALPTYNITLPGGPHLNDRIAILGIGANCSPAVLLRKFTQAGIGGAFYLAQATLDQYAVAHSAFIGASAYMPATIAPEKNTQSLVTVGFYTPEQAEALTATEPNYDLAHKAGTVQTRSLENAPVLRHGALLYVSIWGAFTENGQDPVLQSGITQISPLKAEPTIWSAERAAAITGYGNDLLRFAADIKPGPAHLENRLQKTFMLQKSHALPAAIAGIQVKEATLYKQTSGLPQPPVLPRIKYF